MISPQTKALVELSAVPLLTSQIETMRKSIHNLEGFIFKIEKDLQSYAKATTALAEELNAIHQIRTHKTTRINDDGKATYYRDPTSVKGRWLEWKELLEQGYPVSAVARRWGVDRRSVQYARKQNFQPSMFRVATKKPRRKR